MKLSLKEHKFIFLATFSLLSLSSLLKVPININSQLNRRVQCKCDADCLMQTVKRLRFRISRFYFSGCHGCINVVILGSQYFKKQLIINFPLKQFLDMSLIHSLYLLKVKDHSSVTFVKRPSNSQVISKNTSTFTLVLTSLSVRSAIWNSVELMHSANTNWDTEQVTCPVDTVARISCTSVHCDSTEPCIMVSGIQFFHLTLAVKPLDCGMSLNAIPFPLASCSQQRFLAPV